MKNREGKFWVEVIVGLVIGAIACTYLWFLDPKSREELMNVIWMLG